MKNITGLFARTRLVTSNGRLIGTYAAYTPWRGMRIRRR